MPKPLKPTVDLSIGQIAGAVVVGASLLTGGIWLGSLQAQSSTSARSVADHEQRLRDLEQAHLYYRGETLPNAPKVSP